ncbi:hypothetical protein JMF89_06825 [Clostridiaceae bacterium UIB06]|uniref:CRISPR-associated protein n=1 Tax=Clostridium thailandense TaxID=2794346 RepID=A0A949U2G7_9CLOT|nr:hypothetical protein [Clostridium thailandense]MBV7275129.1 hypothetical protein [Clostridium thailandense]MCH5136914.1 hypothetical protein [Clostridiaceae bacterium UIB06]
MKQNILVTNLGNRDLQIHKDNIEAIKELYNDDEEMKEVLDKGRLENDSYMVFSKCFRELTQKILEHYPKGIKYIDFPIIKSIIKKIEGDLEEEKLQKIILMITDQEDINYNGQDTVYLGEIIKKLHSDKKLEIGLNQSKDNIEIVSFCTKSNPSDYDEMRKFYQEKLSKEYDSNKIFLNITGGTPAMAFGLLYNTSINASCRVIPFYTKQNTNRSVKFNVSETIRKDDDKKQICEFITKNDYMAAKILLEKYNKYGVSEKKYETALNMIKAAHARIQFDFKNASIYIEKAEDYDSGSRSICDKFIYFIKELQNNEKIYLLNELKNNAIYEYENGAYTDFLGRVFRMEEDIYRSILIKKDILRINENDNLKLNNKAELESAGIVVKGKLNVPQMSKILDAILEKESEEYKLYVHCTKMDKLRQIRNDSVLAHGYKGVSKDEIDGEIGNAIEFLDSRILQYKNIYNIEINDDNFYDKNGEFNSHLRELIEEI